MPGSASCAMSGAVYTFGRSLPSHDATRSFKAPGPLGPYFSGTRHQCQAPQADIYSIRRFVASRPFPLAEELAFCV